MLDYEKEYEKKAFKAMRGKEKIDHIWTYYKMPILTGAFLIFFAGWWINYLFINPPEKTGFAIYAYAGAIDDTAVEPLEEKYKHDLPHFLEEKEKFEIRTFLDIEENITTVEQKIASLTTIAAEVSMGNVDVIIGDRDRMVTLIASEFFVPLDRIFTEEEWEELQKSANERASRYVKKEEKDIEGIIRAEVISENKEEYMEYPGEQPYLLCIGGCRDEEKIFYDICSPYLGVISNTRNLDQVKEYIWYLMAQE